MSNYTPRFPKTQTGRTVYALFSRRIYLTLYSMYPNPSMHHAILGAGGVGGFIAGCLAHIGEQVTLIVRPETLSDHPAKIQLESPYGNWFADVAWTASVPACDVLWLSMKATQLENALHPITNVESIRALVPLLNGLDHLPVLRSKFSVDRVIPATIAGEFERVSVGHFVHRTKFAVLNLSGRGRELLQPIADRLRSLGVTCNFIDDEPTLMWSKLVFLGPIALTTTAFDRTVGEVVADPVSWPQLEGAVREAAAAAQAEGAKVDADKVLANFKNGPPGMRSSMQKDVGNGRPPELDAIGGAIVRAAHRHGLTAPITEDLMAKVERRRLEVGKSS
jgi:2-dehydropantoate 2-reductase